MFDMIFNGKSSREMAVAVTTRPSIPAPAMRGEWVDLGDVDGSLLVTDGTYGNIEISVQLNYACPRDKVGLQYRRLKEWISGAGELSFTDDYEVYYKVKAAQIAEYSRITRMGAELQAVFICDPYAYFKSGKYPVNKAFAANNSSDRLALTNNYALARPLYKISGGDEPMIFPYSPACNLIVNGSTLTCYRADNLFIDTERFAVYTAEGTLPGLKNDWVSGNLDDLVLVKGSNIIQITGNALPLNLEVIPNWRAL